MLLLECSPPPIFVGFGKTRSATHHLQSALTTFGQSCMWWLSHMCRYNCTDVIYSPERVQGPFLKQPATQVSCGWKHTAAISGGNIYTWGWGGSNGTFKEDGHSPGGQLGYGDDVDYIEPTLLDFYKKVKAVQVSCGFNHTAALFEYKSE